MSMTDPIADFLTRIRNATQRKHATVVIPASRVKRELARVLKSEGFIREFREEKNARGHPQIEIELKYDEKGESVIRGLTRISKPGLRRHAGYGDLEPVFNGQGVTIVSTSKGLLADYECRKLQVGGEVLCTVW